MKTLTYRVLFRKEVEGDIPQSYLPYPCVLLQGIGLTPQSLFRKFY